MLIGFIMLITFGVSFLVLSCDSSNKRKKHTFYLTKIKPLNGNAWTNPFANPLAQWTSSDLYFYLLSHPEQNF